jgi:hypothetical protein
MSCDLPPTPGTGLCVCGAAYYFARDVRPPCFHCRRYRWDAWSPPIAAVRQADDEPRAAVVPEDSPL